MLHKATPRLKEVPADGAAEAQAVEQIGQRGNVRLVGAQNGALQTAAQRAQAFKVTAKKDKKV